MRRESRPDRSSTGCRHSSPAGCGPRAPRHRRAPGTRRPLRARRCRTTGRRAAWRGRGAAGGSRPLAPEPAPGLPSPTWPFTSYRVTVLGGMARTCGILPPRSTRGRKLGAAVTRSSLALRALAGAPPAPTGDGGARARARRASLTRRTDAGRGRRRETPRRARARRAARPTSCGRGPREAGGELALLLVGRARELLEPLDEDRLELGQRLARERRQLAAGPDPRLRERAQVAEALARHGPQRALERGAHRLRV